MKMMIKLACTVASTLAFSMAYAGADDAKWIAQCLVDNKDEGAKEEVVFKYCKCMNDKMDDNETLSITAWEKKNPGARKDCEKKAGWK